MKFILAGYIGFGNVGDELLLDVTLEHGKKQFPNAQWVVLSQSPLDTERIHSVQSISRWNVFAVVRHLFTAKALIFGGGGIFQDQTSFRSMIYYGALIGLSRLMRVPVIIISVGVDSLRRQISKWILKWVLQSNMVWMGVRDSSSLAALKESGVHKEVGLFADLVFNLAITVEQPKQSVSLVFREPARVASPHFYQHLIEDIVRRGYSIRGFTFQPGGSFGPDLKGLLADFEQIDFKKAPSQVAMSSHVVSSRFHALVLAALAQRPFLGIGEKRSKIHSLCMQLNMPFLSWDASPPQTQDALNTLFQSKPIDSYRITALKARAKDALVRAFQTIS